MDDEMELAIQQTFSHLKIDDLVFGDEIATHSNVEDFLVHYGKKGMRWGVVNEELPKGTDKAAVAKEAKEDRIREKAAVNFQKAQVYRDRSAKAAAISKELDEQGITSPAMRKLYGNAIDSSDRMFFAVYGVSKSTALETEKKRQLKRKETADKDTLAKEQGRLSSNQKKAIVGGAVALGLVAGLAYLSYPDIVTKNALPGNKISVNNFMKRYSDRVANFTYKPITKSAFDKMSDVDVVVPKGTIFKRLTAFPDETLEKRLYTTFTDADNMKYQGLYGPMLRQRTGSSKLFISSMEMGESIRSPSPKKRVQALIDLLDEDKSGSIKGYLEAIMPFDIYNPTNPDHVFRLNDSNEAVGLKAYNHLARDLVRDTPLTQAYYKKIKSMGYNALVDDNDAGQLSDAPMILLDGAKTVAKRTATELTRTAEKTARKNLVEILDNQTYAG